MSRWTWYVSNETVDTLVLTSASLDYGDWFGGDGPPPVIDAGHDVTWECESGWLGNIRGVAVYASALGNVAFTWEVPFFGGPANNVDSGPYVLRRMGPSGDGGAMVAIAPPPAQD
ncbi:MAG: hypothetical protein M3O50_21565, partial [Myxococcota bacterium]|nr:hypothetical protein [Myxococcota bacterium]